MLQADEETSVNRALAPFPVTELEERLLGPTGAAVAGALLAAWRSRAERISNVMASGLAPEIYDKARVIHDALVAAQDFVLKIRNID